MVFENAASMFEFRRFLDRPGFEKIVVGILDIKLKHCQRIRSI